MSRATASALAHRDVRPATEREFVMFQALIQREAGIHLPASKKALLVRRLSGRLRELGLPNFGAYYRRVTEEGDSVERTRMLDCICTHETHFFREPRQFEFLEKSVFPAWKAEADGGLRPRRLRVWSVPCSTGEEPFSLAITLLHHFPPRTGWRLEVLASDLSMGVLTRARQAEWPIEKAAEIPDRYLRSYMLKGVRSQEGKMKAMPEIRRLVRYQRVNLNDEHYPVAGSFDLILCRNVLIYFDAEVKARVVDRLLRHLDPRGYLLLGHAESLNGLNESLQPIVPTVYAHPTTAATHRNHRSALARRVSRG